MAAARVGTTAELAEVILLNLDNPTDIFRSKRVCSLWKDTIERVIESTHAFDKALWITVEGSPLSYTEIVSPRWPPALHPALYAQTKFTIRNSSHVLYKTVLSAHKLLNSSLGGRCEAMLATNPSVKRLRLTINHPRFQHYWMTSDNGISLGDIRARLEIVMQHEASTIGPDTLCTIAVPTSSPADTRVSYEVHTIINERTYEVW